MTTPFAPGSTVIAYARDSGGEAQELSIDQQLAVITNYCQDNGLILAQSFTDAAQPGSSTVKRDGFLEMIDHFRHGAPEAGLLIWSYSRFSRSIDDSQFYRADLRRRGYIFHAISDDIPDGAIGRFIEAAIDWRNTAFLQDLSRDVKRGLHDLVTRYGAVPGTPPRGFKRVPVVIGSRRDGSQHTAHRWAPDPEITPTVRQAFEMLVAGHSLKEIAEVTQLYKSVNSYLTFFTNPLYMGTLNFGDLSIPGYCPPVVPLETWQAAQLIIEKRARRMHLAGDNPQHPRRNGKRYILTGLAYCARCGSPLNGLTVKGYGRYTCSRAKRSHDCDAKPLPQVFIEQLVIDTLVESILDPDNLTTKQAILQQGETDRQSGLTGQVTDRRRKLANIRRRIANITDTLADEGKSRALIDKLRKLEIEEAEHIAELSRLERLASMQFKTFDSNAAAARLRAALQGDDALVVLRGMVQRISVEREGQTVRVGIAYYIPPAPP